MTTTYADLTNLTDILKQVYGPRIEQQQRREALTYMELPISSRKPGGLGYIFPVHIGSNQAIGAKLESEALPTPQRQRYDKVTITPKYVYGTIRVTGPAIAAAKANVMAFADSLASEISNAFIDVRTDLGRMTFGDGWGQLAVSSAAATTSDSVAWTVTCDNAIGVHYLKEGMYVDFYESDTLDTSSDSAIITSINPATKVVTLSPTGMTTAQAVATAAVIVRENTREDSHDSSTDTAREMMGLLGVIDDGTNLATFQDIDRTAAGKRLWKANYLANSGVDRELTLDLLQRGIDLARYSGGSTINDIRMGLGQRRKYVALLQPDIRYTPGNLDGGFERLTYAGGDARIRITIDPDCVPGAVFQMTKGTIQRYELKALGWADLDGNILHRRSGYDEWNAFLCIYTQIGSTKCNANTHITDLVEPSLY